MSERRGFGVIKDAALVFWGARWLQQHAEFRQMASSLGAYTLKLMLHQLSPPQRRFIEGGLRRMGVNVEQASAFSLGEQAVEMALPVLVDEYLHDGPAAFIAGNAASHILRSLLTQIKAIAGMDERNDAGHKTVAGFIRARRGTRISTEELQRVLDAAYGTGAHWFSLGLHSIEKMGIDLLHQEEETISRLLQAQYAYWHGWAVKFERQIALWEQDAARFVTDMERGWLDRPRSAPTGLFIAHAAPSGAPDAPIKNP